MTCPQVDPSKFGRTVCLRTFVREAALFPVTSRVLFSRCTAWFDAYGRHG
jgi:hypothetical protein